MGVPHVVVSMCVRTPCPYLLLPRVKRSETNSLTIFRLIIFTLISLIHFILAIRNISIESEKCYLPLPPITASTSPSVSTPAMKKKTAMLHSVVSDDEARRTRGVRVVAWDFHAAARDARCSRRVRMKERPSSLICLQINFDRLFFCLEWSSWCFCYSHRSLIPSLSSMAVSSVTCSTISEISSATSSAVGADPSTYSWSGAAS